MILDFQHNQSSHCENGVISNLLKHNGVNISEAMIFGTGSGLFFGYMPFLKLNHIPVATFRPVPGIIFKRATKRLGIGIFKNTFKNPEKSMDALDAALDKNLPVGLQVGAYHLTYFPRALRFHFNMHNIVVFGKEGNTYHISDPVLENPVTLTRDELLKVRYAKGPFAPNGKMYYPISFPEKITLESAIRKGISQTCSQMLNIPVPLFGVKGIRYLAKRMEKWPTKLGDKTAALWLGQFIRMMEEIGTGGAGFRFIYSAFLQESSVVLNKPEMKQLSLEMTKIGDIWREFSVNAARNCKGRGEKIVTYSELSQMLMNIADREELLYKQLKKLI